MSTRVLGWQVRLGPTSSLALPKPEPLRKRSVFRAVGRRSVGIRASSELVEPLASGASPDLTWQIAVGALAGVTPFIVASVEFSKRIMEQRKCQVCGGSGLVKRVGILVRCNGCGGFLPWQSWRQFFSGR